MQELLTSCFNRFEALTQYKEDDTRNRASPRVKILIKNLQDNRNSGWQKSQKQDKKILSKNEVERQMVEQSR